MDIEFLPNNTHLDNPRTFAETDFHLRRMGQQPYIFQSPIISEIPRDIPGVYNVVGGRQVGKTTLLKQWMLYLIKQHIDPKSICFLSCELIFDEQSLYRIVINQLNEMPATGLRYLILDEITYVRSWDKAIKYLADTGALENVVLVISGSDLALMQHARKRFPGRRGTADVVDFHYYPLSFREFLQLKKLLPKGLDEDTDPDKKIITMLYDEFNNYLHHGGFLTAINEYSRSQSISTSTLAIYSDWMRGDFLKRDKSEPFLREILQGIVKHYTKQISWRNLVSEMTIDHTQTVIDYIGLLEAMDAVFVQSALLEDKLLGAPKKQRKLMFCDPFIFHAVRAWLDSTTDPFHRQIETAIKNPILSSELVEACVITHYRRYYPTHYIKAEGEVDIAYVNKKKFWPIEVKWTNQLRPSDLKQVLKYKNAEIFAKVQTKNTLQEIPIIPLPLALAYI